MAWSRVYRIYYDKSRRLSLSSNGRKARYLSYIQNSYASLHSFSTPSITPYLVIPPSCPALSTAPVVVAIGPAGSVPIGWGDLYGTVRSVRGPVGVVVQFEVRTFGVGLWGRTLGSDFGVGVWGRTLGSDFGGLHTGNSLFLVELTVFPFSAVITSCWFLSTHPVARKSILLESVRGFRPPCLTGAR